MKAVGDIQDCFPPMKLGGNNGIIGISYLDREMNMPKILLDWVALDKSDWGNRSDASIARELGVGPHAIGYWRKKLGIAAYDELAERKEKFSQGMHWCSKCKRYLPLDQFGKWSSGYFGLKTHCFECRQQFNIENAEKYAPVNVMNIVAIKTITLLRLRCTANYIARTRAIT